MHVALLATRSVCQLFSCSNSICSFYLQTVCFPDQSMQLQQRISGWVIPPIESLWLDLKHPGATCLSLSSFVKKNGVKLVSRSGSRILRRREWFRAVGSRRAPSEANGPQGQQGHAKIHSGYIWTCGCPPARLSLKSSCLFRNNADKRQQLLFYFSSIKSVFLCDYSPPQSDHCWVAVPKLQKRQHSSVQTLSV